MFHYFAYFSAATKGALPARRPSIVEFQPESFDAFYEFFKDAIRVLVERRDVYAQAVSMYFTHATKTWERRLKSGALPTDYSQFVSFDRERLMEIFKGFMVERAQWPRFFRHYGVTPLRLTYEDAAANYFGYLDGLVEASGITPLPTCPPRRLLKQGDATNDSYTEMLRDEVLKETFARLDAASRPSA